jgi:hypothetical protein
MSVFVNLKRRFAQVNSCLSDDISQEEIHPLTGARNSSSALGQRSYTHLASLLMNTPRFSGVVASSARVRTVLTVSRALTKPLERFCRAAAPRNTLLKQGVNERPQFGSHDAAAGAKSNV